MFNKFFRGGNGGEQGWGAGAWTPPVDIYETDDALVLKAELPSVSKDDVSIEVHQHTLILRGERKHTAAVQDERYYRRECAVPSWRRDTSGTAQSLLGTALGFFMPARQARP